MACYVYILARRPNGTLTSASPTISFAVPTSIGKAWRTGFTKRYGVKRLVHYEPYDDIRLALQRENNIKHWSRAWKIAPIEEQNPHWSDLWAGIARP